VAVVWSSDAYGDGTFSAWNGVQEIAADRGTVIAPPAEVGGGPQSRAWIARYRINAGDAEPLGNVNAQRVEALTTIAMMEGRMCQGQDVWLAWESYFGNPAIVADTNAFRPKTGTDWNFFIQAHQAGGTGNLPWNLKVDARVGTTAATWRFAAITSGGTVSSAPYVKHDLGPFSYGWHEFKIYMKYGQGSNGRFKVWMDDFSAAGVVLDYTGPIGLNPDATGGTCNYLKQGMYRGVTTNASTVFAAGTRMGTTEADVVAGGGSEPPPDTSGTPDANTRSRRFGKATVGSGRNGFSADSKRGSKFATGLSGSEEADVKDMHIWAEGADGSASMQKITLGIYADDGGSGLPGTKFGESNVELSIAGNATADWHKVTPSSPIRVTGANAWLIAISGAPSSRVRYATDSVANALVFVADTYEVSAPRLADPFGTPSSGDLEVSICADYDVVAGTSPGGGDTTAPALVAASTSVQGDTIVLGYDEPLETASEPAVGDYAVLVDSVARAVSAITMSGSEMQLTLATPVSALNTITFSYTRVGGREVKDLAGNLAANLSGQAVANQTSNESPPVRLTTIARVTTIARSSVPSARIAGQGGGGI
jgi:uncharacterized repeat protein (TIGR02059 family)